MRVPSFIRNYFGMHSNVYIVFFAQFINRFGDFVLPFLTLLIVTKLGMPIYIAGLAVTMTLIASALGSFAGGKLSDVIGRKRTFLISQTSSAVLLLLCSLTNQPQWIVVIVIISSGFKGAIRPVLSAILADSLAPADRQKGFALSYLGINLGVAVGPLLAGFLMDYNYHWLFVIDAITSLIAVVLMTVKLVDIDIEQHVKDEDLEQVSADSLWRVLGKRPYLLLIFFVNIFLAGIYAQHSFSLPIQLGEVYASGAKYFGMMMSINAISVLVLTSFVTLYTQKNHALINMVLGSICYALGFGVLGISLNLFVVVVSTVIWTLGEILFVTNFGVFVSAVTPANFRGRMNAVGGVSWSIGAVLGTTGVGMLTSRYGLWLVWPLSFVLALISGLALYTIYNHFFKKLVR